MSQDCIILCVCVCVCVCVCMYVCCMQVTSSNSKIHFICLYENIPLDMIIKINKYKKIQQKETCQTLVLTFIMS